MTDIQALLAGLGWEQREELYEAAARYAEYSFYRDLGKLPAHLDREQLESFKKIDADSSAQKALKDLWAHRTEQDGRAWIAPPCARSSSPNLAELFLKGLENVTNDCDGHQPDRA